jgi:hypothetical protein
MADILERKYYTEFQLSKILNGFVVQLSGVIL